MKIKREIVLTPKQLLVMKQYLAGQLSTRQAAKLLDLSHQSIINLTAALACQWFQQGKFTL